MSIPLQAHATVRISEIAWMGIAGEGGQYGEWIELFNDGAEAVSLSGWNIFVDGGAQVLFSLSTSIPAGGYLVIERTTSSMTDPLPTVSGERGAFGGGGLSNVGEDLVLKDAGGAIVHALNFASGWPAGDATTKQTMQWDGSSWQTKGGTPGAGVEGSASSESTPVSEEVPASSDTPPNTIVKKTKPIPKVKPEPHIALTLPKQLSIHMPYRFKASVMTEEGLNPHQGVYRWNFGDGTMIEEHQTFLPVVHTYEHPGTYTIFFGYYDSFFAEDPILYIQNEVTVTTPTLSLSIVEGALRIENTTVAPVDLSQFSIRAQGSSVPLPKMTIIGPRATVMLSSTRLGISLDQSTTIHAPDGFLMGRIAPPAVLGAFATSSVPTEVGVVEVPLVFEEEIPLPPPPFAPLAQEKSRDPRQYLLAIAGFGILALFLLIDRGYRQRRS